MLEDRSYMREDSFGSRRSVTFILLVALVVIWLVENLLYQYTGLARRFSLPLFGALGQEWQTPRCSPCLIRIVALGVVFIVPIVLGGTLPIVFFLQIQDILVIDVQVARVAVAGTA